MWPHCEFHLPLPSLLAAGTTVLTKTPYFCHRPRDTPFPSYLSLSSAGVEGTTMRAWRDQGHGWVVENQNVVCGFTACVPLLQLPLSAPSLFLCLQWITGGSMQIAYYGPKWYGSLCAVPFVCQCLLPLRSLWHGPSLSWSPGYPGWSFAVGPGESLPQTGWSCASRSSHLKHRCHVLSSADAMMQWAAYKYAKTDKKTQKLTLAWNKNGKKWYEGLVI